MSTPEVLDALIVGAGFSGTRTLHRLRAEGFNAKIFESGTDMGGVWHWNCYPGARVDSPGMIYQVPDNTLAYQYKERYPGGEELHTYFNYLDTKLDLRKDIYFSTYVISAKFHEDRNQWWIEAQNGRSTWAHHLILATGFAARRYTPPFPGLDQFQGESYHTGTWPKDGVDLTGKRVAVIGTGASGVQVIQEIGPIVEHLTVYQRTPNLALPMQQRKKGENGWHPPGKDELEAIFKKMFTTFGGFHSEFKAVNALDETEAQRKQFYEALFENGGLESWVASYQDVLFDTVANDTAYDFWAEKVRARINDPVKKDLLAPLNKDKPHAYGVKRPSLEQSYYEVFNQRNVDLINLNDSPILEITRNGIKTVKEGETKLDVIVFATGFDSHTGGILDIKILNGKGESLQQKWKNGTFTYLGIAAAGFPNMYFMYGPQSPSAFCNGPTCAEVQSKWITNTLEYLKSSNYERIEATEEAEREYKEVVQSLWNASLFPNVQSWYQGDNIPGKPREALNYIGGAPAYIELLEECAKNNYNGFVCK